MTEQCDKPSDTCSNKCKPLDPICSALININTARKECLYAHHAWMDEMWPEAVMSIDTAIGQLESARAKIKEYAICNPSSK